MSMGAFLIAGGGALGSVFGAKLRARGYKVTILGRSAHLAAIERHGLHVTGLLGESRISGFELAEEARAVRGRFRIILIAVKSYDTEAIAASIAEHLHDDGVVLSIQNGLTNIEMLGKYFGCERVLGSRVMLGAELLRPGAVRVTVFGEPLALGPAPGADGAVDLSLARWAEALAALLTDAGIQSEAWADVMPALWTKLFYNAALNPLGALLRLHYGALAADPGLRRIMDQTIDEAFAVAQRLNVAVPFANAKEYRRRFYDVLVPATFNHRPSMLYDLEHRGRTEIDALNGKIVALADELKMDASMNRTLTDLIHAAERVRQPEGASK